MKPTVIAGILCVVLAMIAYTVGAWSAYRSKGFKPFNITVLWVGVVFDILATSSMWLANGGAFKLSPTADLIHTVLALVSFFGMAIVTASASWAYAKKNKSVQRTLAKLILAPWALWAIIFLWGMARPPKPGS
jgi:hypothetical protein